MNIFGSKSRTITLSPQHALLDIYAKAGLNGFTLPAELALKHVDKKKMKKDAAAPPTVPRDASGHVILGINDAYVLLITYVSQVRRSGVNPHRHQRSIALRHTFVRYINQTYIEKVQADGNEARAKHLRAERNLLIVRPLQRLIEQDRLQSFYREVPDLTISFTEIDEAPGGLIALALMSTDSVNREKQHHKLAAQAVDIYRLNLAGQGLTLADVQQEMCPDYFSPRRVE